jgi:hypothetical protein
MRDLEISLEPPYECKIMGIEGYLSEELSFLKYFSS